MPVPLPSDPATSLIRVRGARVHNLQNIDVDIPRGKFVVVTGVSGSGKSSLAFDTLFAEGQRRYLETLSSQTRAYLDQMQRPDVDDIEGLPPTLSVEQHVGHIHPRSTLATTTGIHEFLRLLYARAGSAHCPNCGRVLSQQSTQAIVDSILALEAGRKAMILAPLVRGKKGIHRELFEKICREGFVRARVDGEVVDAGSPPPLKKSKPHDIDVIVDRIVVKDGLRARLHESVDLSLRHGNGSCVISHEDATGWHDRLYSARFACPDCQLSFSEIEPRTFSFNSPYGACPTCEGLDFITNNLPEMRGERPSTTPPLSKGGPGGVALQETDPTRLARTSLTPASPHPTTCPDCHGARLAPVGRAVTLAGVAIQTLLAQTVAQAEASFGALLLSFDSEPGTAASSGGPTESDVNAPIAGSPVIHSDVRRPLPIGERTPVTPTKHAVAVGSGLNEGGAATQDAGIPWTGAGDLSPQARLVALRLLPEIHRRLKFLRQVGVDYLSLDRPTNTLSGGEFQRARIAGCLGGGLIGVCYILDEPTIGLHPRDTERLLESLLALRDQGNSLIVVEHDLDVMTRADHLIDLGPGAGREGGRIVSAGTPTDVAGDECSLTGRYLRSRFDHCGAGVSPADEQARRLHRNKTGKSGNRSAQGTLNLTGATARNLKNLSVDFPLGCVTCVTGVSGSGKSTLVMETLVPKLRAVLAARPWGRLPDAAASASKAAAATETSVDGLPGTLTGTELIDRLVEIDQSPLGRNARSNPATVSGIWDEIRRLFARTRDARVRGFRSARFSFNASGGRCEECRGQGTRRVSMQFLPDMEVVCPACHGARFNRQTLHVKFRGKSVADILAMRIDEAVVFFENFAGLHAQLQTFVDVGLGYLSLGQSATTLSGGEAQRIKLAAELGRKQPGRTLYVLDEPTTGLHPADIERLLDLLERLADEGHTVIVVEHQLDVIARADWVIDLGPEGGSSGGHLVAAGTPDEITRVPASHTGRALRTIVHEPA